VSLPSPGRVLRTLRHLRARQAVAQAAHVLRRGAPGPARTGGPPPPLAPGGPPPVPFLGAPRHARWDGAGAIELLNRAEDFGAAIDWDHAAAGPLWAFHLHQFDWARAPDLAPAARAAVLLDWIERHRSGVGWSPHPISLRALAWGKLLLAPGALALDAAAAERVRASLASQIETLSRELEVRLQANHLLSNLLGVIWGGLLFAGPRAERWLALESALRRELDEQILPDGAHVERSPMYHSLLLENVLDLLNLARARPGRAPVPLVERLAEAAARMRGALRVWTLPDGEIALFADAALGIAHPPAALDAYADALGVAARGPRPPGALPAAGYVRLESPPFALVASLAGPSPAWQPGHAHGDALAFELAVGATRVVTDTGVFEYVPGPRRDAARATCQHATIEVGGRDQAEFWSAHRVGGRPAVAIEALEPPRRAAGSCAGWATRDTVHRRELLAEQGRSGIEVRDALEGVARPVRLTLPLAPGLEPRLEGPLARVELPGGRALRIELPRDGDLAWRIERIPCFPEFGRALERAALVGEARSFRRGVWRFSLLA
jgi:hypothetical protein